MTDPGQILRYYPLVDAKDITGLLSVFDHDIVYHRPGYPPIVGLADLRRFYQRTRVIAAGRHMITNVVRDRPAGKIAVEGTFEGQLQDGSAASLRWADFWATRPDGRATRRDTYFFAALV